METLSTEVWGLSGLESDPAWEALVAGKAPGRASTNCHTKGHSPFGGLKSCPHSAHLPVGSWTQASSLLPGVISSSCPKGQQYVVSVSACAPTVFSESEGMAQATAVQLTGRIQYPSRDLQRTCTNLQKPTKAPSARGRCGHPPVQRTRDFDMDQSVQRTLGL